PLCLQAVNQSPDILASAAQAMPVAAPAHQLRKEQIMKRTVGYAPLLFSLLLLAFSIPASAEVLTGSVALTPGGEVNPMPAPPPNASGAFLITVNVTRDGTGAVTAGAINFLGTVNFPGGANITVTGLHIHEGAINANGTVRFDSGLSG